MSVPLTPDEAATAPAAQPSRASRLIRGSSWRVFAQIMPLFINLALTPYVITTLGRVGYGLWLISSTLAQFIAHFDGGLSRSAQNYFAVFVGRKDTTGLTRLWFTLSLIAAALMSLVLVPAFIFAPSIASFFSAPAEFREDTIWLIRVLLVIVGLGLLRNLLVAVLHAHERFALTSIATLLGYLVYAAGMVLTLSNGLGLRGVSYAFIAQHAVITLVLVPPALLHLTVTGLRIVGWNELLPVARVSWRVQISEILSVASLQGVILIVGRLRPTQVPDFGPGATFAQQLKLIPMNGVVPIQAMLGRSVGERGAATTTEEFERIQRAWVAAVTGWTVVGAPAAYVGVNVWLPLEGDLAGRVAALMLGAYLLTLLPQVLLQWLVLVDRAQYEMWANAVTVAVLVVLSLVLVPIVGAIGAAVAALAGQAAGLIVLLLASRSLEISVPSPLRDLPWWQALAAGALSFALVWQVGRLAQSGVLPDGGLGLLACGAAAAPAMLFFLLITWGPRRTLTLLRSRLRPGR